ncbi:hypothetical protein JCM5350_001594 [Sporobolomyces pararoseus]
MSTSTSTTTSTSSDSSNYTPRTTITDPIFLQGLASILAPYYDRQASIEEIQRVTERAESFYLASQGSSTTTQSIEPLLPPPPPPHPDVTVTSEQLSPSSSSSSEPPYPISFSHLAHLIQTGQPIPGIKQIPDRLTKELPSQSQEQVRRKPWEKINVKAEEEEHDRIELEGGKGKAE